MNLRKVIIALAATIQAGNAMAIEPVAEASCAPVICLSPEPGTPAPDACTPIRATYFGIRVFDPDYNSAATAAARAAFLSTCTTATPADLTAIKSRYGKLYSDPISN